MEVCAEAVASEARKARQIKRLVAEAVDDLIGWSVVEAVPPSPMLRRAGEATHDFAISNHLARTPFNPERNFVEN